MRHLLNHFDLEELSLSMGQNGYFDEEPLVAIPLNLPPAIVPKAGESPSAEYIAFIKSDSTEFRVVEGNRRLATVRILLSVETRQALKVRNWPELTTEIRSDLEILPVIVYPTRKEVLPYLGVRHITGNKKWDSYAKARYIVAMLDEGYSVEDIENEVGDRSQGVLKNAISYKLLEQAKEELDVDITRAKEDFSYMLLAIGQRNIKLFFGWTKPSQREGETKVLPLSEVSLDSPVADSHLNNLKDFLSWVYGEGSKVLPVIKESRDITNYLSHVVGSEGAISYLRKSRDLKEAYELTNGEESMLRGLLVTANTKLEKALGVVHRHKTPDVLTEAEKCSITAAQILKTVRE